MRKTVSFFLLVGWVLGWGGPALAQDSGRAYYDLGVFAYEDKQYEEAVRNLEKALTFDPENPFYHHFLGKTYMEMGRNEAAKESLDRARALDPAISGLAYDLARFHYKTGNHGTAGELFSTVAAEEKENVLAHYYAGISFYNTKAYRRALDHFTQAADRSPALRANASYYAGICYLQTGQTAEAEEMFAYVKESAESGSLRENAAQWLQAAGRYQDTDGPLDLHLRVGYQYDDNVRLASEDVGSDESDWAVETYFRGRLKVGEPQKFNVGAGLSHYQTRHRDLEAYDLRGSVVDMFGSYRIRALTIGMAYLHSVYLVDTEKYLMRHQLRPQVTWNVMERLIARLSYTYSDNTYFTNEDKEGHSHQGTVGAYYLLGADRGHLYGGIGYEAFNAKAPEAYGSVEARAGLSLNLPWQLSLGVSGWYEDQEYDEIDRSDDKYSAKISLSRRLYYEWLGMMAEFNYTNNDSSVDRFDYERGVTTVSVTADF